MQKNNTIVYAKLSKAGLGNKLFVWAKGIIYMEKSGADFFTSSWVDFHPGVYLRILKGKQRDWRFYNGLFKKQSLIKRIYLIYYIVFYKKIFEPFIEPVYSKRTLVIFNKIPYSGNFLDEIKDHRELIISELYKMISPSLVKKASTLRAPLIAIHIRKGDLVERLRTPNGDIIKIIKYLRQYLGQETPIVIFSDGSIKELAEILALPKVTLIRNNNPLLDMLHLSKSSIIVPSITSSFSNWAGFLSDAVILRHPSDIVTNQIRVDTKTKHYQEFRFNDKLELPDPGILNKIISNLKE